MPVIFSKIKVAKFHKACTVSDLMPMSNGDERQKISCSMGLTDSQHGQLKPPTRPGQFASGEFCDQRKKFIFYNAEFFLRNDCFGKAWTRSIENLRL
jgi:hypothetical protein